MAAGPSSTATSLSGSTTGCGLSTGAGGTRARDATPVTRPLVVAGLPRTGTTLLLDLLDRDPANRPLKRWEALDAVPPPTDLDDDPRIGPTVAATEAMYDGIPELKAMHYERGDGPTECGLLLGQDFRCPDAAGLAYVPGYVRWLLDADLTPAYRYHRTELEVLQAHRDGRWVLKSPLHLLGLDALLDVYPDARLVVTHRDPRDAVASTARLVNLGVSVLADEVDAEAVARLWLDVLGAMADRLVAFRDAHPEVPVVDVHQQELAADPVGTVARIHDAFGEELSPSAVTAMYDHLAAHPRGEHGTYAYTLEEFGLAAGEVDERFATYVERFAVRADPA